MYSISIILPLVSSGGVSLQSAENLLHSTTEDTEIIVVHSSPLPHPLCSSRIKAVQCADDNIYAARNMGIAAAQGRGIIFADSSFIPHTGSIEAACKALEEGCDLVVFATEKNGRKIYMDTNLYTRSEYTEGISRYITTGLGFDSTSNKVYSAATAATYGLCFREDMPLVADSLFDCRFFAAAGHIKCLSQPLCATEEKPLPPTDRYLEQGRVFSQALIDAVQSKGLYGAASQAVMENYKNILYRHLMALCRGGEQLTDRQRSDALSALYGSRDGDVLYIHLGSLPGIKNFLACRLFRYKCSGMLLKLLKS